MAARDVVLCNPVRTAIGTYGGTLKSTPATALGAVAVKAALARAKLDPGKIGSVVMGNVIQAGNKMNPARQASINGGVPVAVPAMTVNRVCGSGAQAVASAAQEILLGFGEGAVAGGMENMDMAPYLMGGGRWGYRMGDAEIYDSMLRDGLNDAFSDEHSGWHTEDLVKTLPDHPRGAGPLGANARRSASARPRRPASSRPRSCRSRCRAARARSTFDKDEHNRPDTTMEMLAKLKPAFRKDGTITAGNAPGLNSAAAAMIVAERGWAEKQGLKPMARLVAYGVGAVEPGMFGMGPFRRCARPWSAPAGRPATSSASRSTRRSPPSRSPSRASSASPRTSSMSKAAPSPTAIRSARPARCLTVRLLHSMARDDIKRGIVTLCIGGGQGIALALERLN